MKLPFVKLPLVKLHFVKLPWNRPPLRTHTHTAHTQETKKQHVYMAATMLNIQTHAQNKKSPNLLKLQLPNERNLLLCCYQHTFMLLWFHMGVIS